MKALIIKADGTTPYVKDIENDLETLQSEVGGMIESIPHQTEATTVYGNEEGKIMGLAINQNLAALRALKVAVMAHDIIVGDVVVVGFNAETGDDKDVDPKVVATVLDAVAQGN